MPGEWAERGDQVDPESDREPVGQGAGPDRQVEPGAEPPETQRVWLTQLSEDLRRAREGQAGPEPEAAPGGSREAVEDSPRTEPETGSGGSRNADEGPLLLGEHERAQAERQHEESGRALRADRQQRYIDRLPFGQGAVARAARRWNRFSDRGYAHATRAGVAIAGMPASVRALDVALRHSDLTHAAAPLTLACLAWGTSRAVIVLGGRGYVAVAELLAARRARERSGAADPPRE